MPHDLNLYLFDIALYESFHHLLSFGKVNSLAPSPFHYKGCFYFIDLCYSQQSYVCQLKVAHVGQKLLMMVGFKCEVQQRRALRLVFAVFLFMATTRQRVSVAH